MAVVDRAQIIDEKDGWAILEDAAQRYLGISAARFLAAWESGDYKDTADTTEVMRVAQLIHLVPRHCG